MHLDALRKRLAPQIKKKDIVLLDDSEANIIEVGNAWIDLGMSVSINYLVPFAVYEICE